MYVLYVTGLSGKTQVDDKYSSVNSNFTPNTSKNINLSTIIILKY